MELSQEESDMIESEIENLNVADELASMVREDFIDQHLAVPAVTTLTEGYWNRLICFAPALATLELLDSHVGHHIKIAIIQSFLTGIEWGKTNRPLYTLPAISCDNPDHAHHNKADEN